MSAYWATDYDWRRFEQRFAARPHFITEIDGVGIHFIHVRSEHADALPLIVTHGWPGSTVEQLKIIDPLTDPTEHRASAADACHLVIPSLPGHGFSGKPTETGWDPIRIARAWVTLMQRLGYTRFVAQGGDWGNAVTEQMALLKPEGLLGIHTNMPGDGSPDVSKALAAGGPRPRASQPTRNGPTTSSSTSSNRCRLRERDGQPPTDALRHRGLAGRSDERSAAAILPIAGRGLRRAVVDGPVPPGSRTWCSGMSGWPYRRRRVAGPHDASQRDRTTGRPAEVSLP